MRASMGLAPLAVESADDRAAAASSARAASEAAAELARVDEIRAELARRKEKRLVSARVAGQSLGESLVSQTAGSARDWIARSRRLGTTEQTRAAAHEASIAAREAAAISSDAYTSSSLSGVKVGHAASDFAAGSDVILTLKDSRILTGRMADDINDEEDELLNSDLAEAERLKENNSRKAAMKSGASKARYDVYGEEEAELLSKYSDAKEKASLRLGSSGALTAAEQDFQSNRAIYEQDEARRKLNQLVYSLDDNVGPGGEKHQTFQSDFKEIKFKKKKVKANGAAATTTTTATEEGSNGEASNGAAAAGAGGVMKKKGGSASTRRAKAPSSSILDFLPEPSEAERANDLSSRSIKAGSAGSAKQRREDEEARVAKEEKDARYLRAIQNAELKTQQRNTLDLIQAGEQAAAAATANAASSSSSGSMVPPPPSSAPPASAFKNSAAASSSFIPPPPPPPPAAAAAAAALAPPPGLWEEEEDEQLAATLARARRLAAQQKTRRQEAGEDEGNSQAAAPSSAASRAADSVRALADRVKVKRLEDEVRVKQEPVDEDSASATAAAAASSTAAAAAAAPSGAARSAPPGMRVKAESDGIVFTATTEFVRGLQFEREEQREEQLQQQKKIKKEQQAAAASAAAAAGPSAMELDSDDEKKSGSKVLSNGKVSIRDGAVHSDDDRMEEGEYAAEDGGDQGASSDDEDDSGDEDTGLRSDEPYAVTGVAAALALYKARGILKEGGNGRGDPGDKFNLEKYDAFGREQSKKEQFRSLSHRFHGMEPGLKKTEKRLKKVQEEAQRLQSLRETGGVAGKMAEKQKQLGTAHVVMDKKLTQALATGGGGAGAAAAAAAAGEEGGGKRKKQAGPFAQFGFGKGNFKKRKAAQEADSKAKAAKTEQ